MSGLVMMLSVWSVLACILIALLIYRTILNNHDGGQIFLDRAEASLEREQMDVVRRINRLDPLLRWLGGATGALLLIIGAWWLYFGLFAASAPPAY